MIKCGSFLIALLLCPTLYLCSAGDTLSVTCDGNSQQTYFKVNTKYYFIWHTNVSWFNAIHICRRLGGDLALIESASEMQSISNYLISQGYGNTWLWTSGNDLVQNRKFLSVTSGMPLPYTEWSGGQPDNAGGNEHCVHLWLRNNSFRMNDWICSSPAQVLCQSQNHSRCIDDYN
ncbi:C-type lectin 37Db-like [Drosophila hydei]|uniref:C-type lectin 37Db-like n=1 Tax=Drosophila hydei TaxID=7224 RepID=A0A6J1LYU0_DROHY|nr:C-type lectin 37Db-like [Drosophila hydei]